MQQDIVKKFSKIAFINAVVGVCTIGACPAFALMAISIGFVLKRKGVELDDDSAMKIRYSFILAAVSLAFFAVDIALLSLFAKYK